MEDITAALCLDNRLWQRLYPIQLTNRRSYGISVFIFPIPSSSSFSSTHPSSLLLYPPVLPLISRWYSVSANGVCLQGCYQIHYQVGQQFPHCFTQRCVLYGKKEGGREREWGGMGGSKPCTGFLGEIRNECKYKSNSTTGKKDSAFRVSCACTKNDHKEPAVTYIQPISVFSCLQFSWVTSKDLTWFILTHKEQDVYNTCIGGNTNVELSTGCILRLIMTCSCCAIM